MAAPSTTTTTRQNPSDFLKKITGRFVVVKLHNGSDYRGALKCLDGYMNIVLEQTEEYINGEFKRKYGDAFIRASLTGDDGEDVSSFWFCCGCFSSCFGCSGCFSSTLLFSCLSTCSPFVAAESKSSTNSGTSSSSEPLLSALSIRGTRSVTCFVSA